MRARVFIMNITYKVKVNLYSFYSPYSADGYFNETSKIESETNFNFRFRLHI